VPIEKSFHHADTQCVGSNFEIRTREKPTLSVADVAIYKQPIRNYSTTACSADWSRSGIVTFTNLQVNQSTVPSITFQDATILETRSEKMHGIIIIIF